MTADERSFVVTSPVASRTFTIVRTVERRKLMGTPDTNKVVGGYPPGTFVAWGQTNITLGEILDTFENLP